MIWHRLLTCILLTIPALSVACRRPAVSNVGPPSELVICATVYPLADVARNVGGKWIKVTWLLEGGRRVQGYKPSPAALERLRRSDLIITSGYDERWADDELSAEYRADHVIRPEYSQIIQNLAREQHLNDVSGPYWLDPAVVQELVGTIRDRLSILDPDHASEYKKNADDYRQKLQTLLAEHDVSLTVPPVVAPSRRLDLSSGSIERTEKGRSPDWMPKASGLGLPAETRWTFPLPATTRSSATSEGGGLFSFLSMRECWFPLAQRCNCQEIAPINTDPWLLNDVNIRQMRDLANQAHTPWLAADANWPATVLTHLQEQTRMKLLLLDTLGTSAERGSSSAPSFGLYKGLEGVPPRTTYLEILRYNLHQLERARRQG